jgi:acyl-coenzyme A synthetase/AMP-(fatty) acid ligase
LLLALKSLPPNVLTPCPAHAHLLCRYHDIVGDGRCPIVDTWWQTETGGHMITPLPNAWPQKPGSATFPFFGVVPALLDEKGNEVKGEGEGYLCIKQVGGRPVASTVWACTPELMCL